MVSEIQQRNNNGMMQNRQPRAATQGGHIFGARGNAYGGSKLTQQKKVGWQQQAFSNQGTEQSFNGYVVSQNNTANSNASPKYTQKGKYFSNQQPLMNMKFPTTSHGNRSSTNHTSNYANMQNVLGNIQKHI